jgi:hypothetical protein
MDNQLRSLLTELIADELRRNNTNNSRTGARNTGGNINETAQIITLLRELIYGYNEQMRDYAENMRIVLQLIQTLQDNLPMSPRRQSNTFTYAQQNRYAYTPPNMNRTHTNHPNHARQNTNARQRQVYEPNRFLSWLIYPLNDLSGNAINANFNDNVIVRPTQEQIQSATQFISYNSDNVTQTRCPITLEDFEDGEMVRRIVHCGHTFCETAIQNWFHSNVRCPVCRYDIRTLPNDNLSNQQVPVQAPVSEPTQSPVNEPNTNDDNFTDELFQSLTTNITNILQNYVNNENSENSLYDISFNFVY